MLGVPVQRLQRSEFAIWGSALIAGHGVGLYPDLVAAAQDSARPDGNPFINRPDQTALYAPLVRQYIAWQGTLSAVFREHGGTANA